MGTLRQIVEISAINLRSVRARLGAALVVCSGIAGVVAVLVTVLAMAAGLRTAYASAARDDRAIVLSLGSHAEAASALSREDVAAIESGPGLLSIQDGARAVSAELLLPVGVPRKGEPGDGTVTVRGLTPIAVAVRPEIRLVAGRMFGSGVREVIVGNSAHDQFDRLDIGDTVRFYNGDWRVVGLFASRGDAHESELLADADTLMSAARRTGFNAATVVLAEPAAFTAFAQTLLRDPRLKVEVLPEAEYYGRRSEQAGALVEIVATTVAAIMAVGALLGALNVMYTTVGSRHVEIATMRAIGFGATPVVVSVLIEALAFAVVGAAIGATVAWSFFDGGAFTTGGLFGQVAGHLRIGASQIAEGAAWAVVIGLLGGLFPAIHAARRSVSDALRAV